MPTYKLTYFDFNGGRGEPIRLAMHLGNINFEDKRFPFSDFADVAAETPLKQVPTLAIDGKQVTQCNALTRYVGKLAGLYPTDNYQALMCDEILDLVEDATHRLVSTFGLEGEALESARKQLVEGPYSRYLHFLSQRLQDNGNEHFAGNSISVADLKVYVWIRALNGGNLDHIPTQLVEDIAPNLNTFEKRLSEIPAIKDYYKQF